MKEAFAAGFIIAGLLTIALASASIAPLACLALGLFLIIVGLAFFNDLALGAAFCGFLTMFALSASATSHNHPSYGNNNSLVTPQYITTSHNHPRNNTLFSNVHGHPGSNVHGHHNTTTSSISDGLFIRG